MSKLILKSPYFKSGSAAPSYAKYIATRDGVEKIQHTNSDQPTTKSQESLIAEILHDYPDAKELFEYADFVNAPTVGSASSFITMALESNWLAASKSEIYAKYIATRPGTEKHGAHGLFGDKEYVDLNAVITGLENYTGRVWTHIVSLRREDASRLGYDNASAWRHLLLEQRSVIAKAMNIEPLDLRWYAAYHDVDSHPHIHMMTWSAKPGSGYLNVEGIRTIRSALTNDIFRDELHHLYEEKSVSRDELVNEARSAIAELIAQMQSGVCDSPEIARRVLELAEQLESENGKMQYGYLKPRLKSMVNEIADELERIPAIRECYEKWWELQGAVQNYYTGEPPARLPLSQQKEFKVIKNAVIREAVNVANGMMSFEDDAVGVVMGNDPQYIEVKKCMTEADAEPEKLPLVINHLKKHSALSNQFAQYQLGKLYLAGEDAEQNIDKAVQYFTASAEQGNQYAQYALGKLYLLDKAVPRDKETALHWLELSAAQGNIHAQFFIDHANDHGNPSALLSATRLLHHMGNIFRDNSALPGNSRGIFIDSKRRRKLREMKIAAGHAEDDQDSEYTQIMSY